MPSRGGNLAILSLLLAVIPIVIFLPGIGENYGFSHVNGTMNQSAGGGLESAVLFLPGLLIILYMLIALIILQYDLSN